MSSVYHVNCDAASAAARPEGRSAHPRLVLAVTILASSLAFIDGSVVNVGLPAIGRGLHADAADLQWLINAYLLPLSALLLLGGAAGDRFGQRRLLVIGTALFAVASTGCAAAPNLDWLLVSRGVQGLGAALLMPNSLSILGGAFAGEARGRAIGTWAAAGAAAGAIGPVLGGWLIDTVGWRAIFLINVPIAAAAIGLALAFVRDASGESASALDTPGALTATLALGALTWGLTLGASAKGWNREALMAVLVGVVALAVFVWIEHRRGDRAMMPLAMFGSRSYVGLTLLTLLLYGALGGMLVLIPYELMQAAGYSGTAAGAALLPFPLVMAIASPSLGGLAGRIGARLPLSLGSMLVAAAFALATRIGVGDYWTTVLPAVLLLAFGMACAAAPLTTAVLGAVDAPHRGAASGFNSAVARAGGLIATALLGPVLSARGSDLIAAFHAAALAGAAAALAAAACAWLLIRDQPSSQGEPPR